MVMVSTQSSKEGDAITPSLLGGVMSSSSGISSSWTRQGMMFWLSSWFWFSLVMGGYCIVVGERKMGKTLIPTYGATNSIKLEEVEQKYYNP
jgi:hypothetical protein